MFSGMGILKILERRTSPAFYISDCQIRQRIFGFRHGCPSAAVADAVVPVSASVSVFVSVSVSVSYSFSGLGCVVRPAARI